MEYFSNSKLFALSVHLFIILVTNSFSTPVGNLASINAAVQADNIDVVRQYLKTNGIQSMDNLDEFGYRPLHYANSLDMLTIFLNNGINIDSMTIENSTLLHLAVQRNDKDMILQLVEKGANLNKNDTFGKTPLIYAIEGKQADMVKFLLTNGAVVRKCDQDWSTLKGTEEITKMLRYFEVKREGKNYAKKLEKIGLKISESTEEVSEFMDIITNLAKISDVSDTQMKKIIKEFDMVNTLDLVDQNLSQAKNHVNEWNALIFPHVESNLFDIGSFPKRVLDEYNLISPKMQSLFVGTLSEAEIQEKIESERTRLFSFVRLGPAKLKSELKLYERTLRKRSLNYEKVFKELLVFVDQIKDMVHQENEKATKSINFLRAFKNNLQNDIGNFKNDIQVLKQFMLVVTRKMFKIINDLKVHENSNNRTFLDVQEFQKRTQNYLKELSQWPKQSKIVNDTQRSIEMADSQNSYKFKILNLNLWGLLSIISKDREARFRDLANFIAQSDYDVIILQEVWLTQQEEFKNLLKVTRTKFPHFASSENISKCDAMINFGNVFLTEKFTNCAGLLTLSRHPLKARFIPYKENGHGGSEFLQSNLASNFEGAVGKGVLQTTLKLNETLTIDIFNTHLVSYTHGGAIGLDGKLIKNFVDDITHKGVRAIQTTTLIEAIRNSTADIKIFGGDMNALPIKGEKDAYGRMNIEMVDSLIERYPEASWNPFFATHSRKGNTYSGNECPSRIDYLMHWANDMSWKMSTVDFKIPKINATNDNGDIVSISDHEPLHAEYLISPHSDGLTLCGSDPCQNNGGCIDTIGDYTCKCNVNFHGKNCEIYELERDSCASESPLSGQNYLELYDSRPSLNFFENIQRGLHKGLIKEVELQNKLDDITKLLDNTETHVDLMSLQGDKTIELIKYERAFIKLMKGTIGRPNIHKYRVMFQQSLNNLLLDMNTLKNVFDDALEDLSVISHGGVGENDEELVTKAKDVAAKLKKFKKHWMVMNT